MVTVESPATHRFDEAFPMIPKEPAAAAAADSHPEPKMTLTVCEIADELNISRSTAYQLVKKPDFPSFSIGNRILVSRAGLQSWIDEQSRKPLHLTAEAFA